MNEAYGCRFENCYWLYKKNQRAFQPHLTVANRDIPAGVSKNVLEVMNELNLVEDFSVNNVTIFERKGDKWESVWTGELK